MAVDEELAERVREGLGDRPFREVKMFGGLSFLIDEKLVVSVRGQGGLLVRCDPESIDELLGRDGTGWAEMRGKPMKQGWLQVDTDVLDDEALAFWLDVAVAYNQRLG